MSVPAVEVHNLTKVFSLSLQRDYLVAVKNISFTVGAGEIYGLIGPNGSGKSTTMKVILGLMKPTRGSTSIFGVDSRDVRSRHQVGFLPENPYFYKHLSGWETLQFYGKLCGLKKSVLKDRCAELLAMVDLEDAAKRRLSGYSKGMLQRIGLAQAIIQRPQLVILDEPTAGVDPAGSRKIRDLIMQLKQDGVAVILCSHQLEQVQEVCDRVAIMQKGEMLREGALDDLIAVEDEVELVVKNLPAALQEQIEQLVKDDEKAQLVRVGHPRTTLERLFLSETEAGTKASKTEGEV
ncbi:MAG: ABC transporter ATP-binding protein [Verrucomicrobiales bacterium]|nr:ABC transporter ATP-binding protein [Verrucomicrobiales bacterium]